MFQKHRHAENETAAIAERYNSPVDRCSGKFYRKPLVAFVMFGATSPGNSMRMHIFVRRIIKGAIMPNEKKGYPILEHIVGPIVAGIAVGVVMLLGQYVVAPSIAHKETQRSELLKAKQETYLAAIGLVDRFFLSFPWKQADVQARNNQLGSRPSREDVNQCLGKMLLVEDDTTVSEQFLRCFGYPEKCISPAFRDDLINVMRKDLYGAKRLASATAVPFYLTFDDLVDAGPITSKSQDH